VGWGRQYYLQKQNVWLKKFKLIRGGHWVLVARGWIWGKSLGELEMEDGYYFFYLAHLLSLEGVRKGVPWRIRLEGFCAWG
jgi:hypothetical protein